MAEHVAAPVAIVGGHPVAFSHLADDAVDLACREGLRQKQILAAVGGVAHN